ncbi:MAG: hypothetical protein Q8O99_03990 [bacterium]|nr:hypothetical protein [bacterium]
MEEFDRFLQLQGKYNPVFKYRRPSEKKLDTIKIELDHIYEEFRKTHSLESDLLPLFQEKREELQVKNQLLVAYREQDFSLLLALQEQYRGSFLPERVKEAQQRFLHPVIQDRQVLGPILSRKKMKAMIAKYLQEHGRNKLPVLFTPDSFARMSVQKRPPDHHVLRVAAGARFRKADLFAALAHELVHLKRYANA